MLIVCTKDISTWFEFIFRLKLSTMFKSESQLSASKTTVQCGSWYLNAARSKNLIWQDWYDGWEFSCSTLFSIYFYFQPSVGKEHKILKKCHAKFQTILATQNQILNKNCILLVDMSVLELYVFFSLANYQTIKFRLYMMFLTFTYLLIFFSLENATFNFLFSPD